LHFPDLVEFILMSLKKKLKKVHFDADAFIANEMKAIEEKGGTEKQLLNMFDKLMDSLTEFSDTLMEDASVLQDAVDTADEILLGELKQHANRLDVVHESVEEVSAVAIIVIITLSMKVINITDITIFIIININVMKVKKNFEKASIGAVRIGSRLAATERERGQIESAIWTMDLIKTFEESPIAMYSELSAVDGKQLLVALPLCLSTKSWGDISQVLFDLRKILVDINADNVLIAQTNVLRVSEAVEGQLLMQFDHTVQAVTADRTNKDLIKKSRDLAHWLHLFNEGQSMQKRYIFSVVERRLPQAIKGGNQLDREQPIKKQSTWSRLKEIGLENKRRRRKYSNEARSGIKRERNEYGEFEHYSDSSSGAESQDDAHDDLDVSSHNSSDSDSSGFGSHSDDEEKEKKKENLKADKDKKDKDNEKVAKILATVDSSTGDINTIHHYFRLHYIIVIKLT
jgi:hypothetical protein